MSDRLRALLHELSDHETQVAATADATAVAEVLRAQVRRRRTLRSSGVGLAAAAAVAGAVAASTLATPAPPDPSVPAPTPSLTAPASSAPSPAPTATPAARVPLGPVTAHPALPPAEPLAAGDLEAATDDWTLALVAPLSGDDPPPHVLYLLGPAGERYEVPTPVDWEGRYLDAWLPGTSLALVADDDGAPEGSKPVAPWQLVDLLTGEVLTTVEPTGEVRRVVMAVDLVGDGTRDVVVTTQEWTSMTGPPTHHVRRVAPGGVVVAEAEPVTAYGETVGSSPVSADGAWVLLSGGNPAHARSTSDLAGTSPAELPYADAPERCRSSSWLGGSALTMTCNPDGAWEPGVTKVETWAVDLAGGPPALLATGAWTLQQWQVGDQVLGLHPTSDDDVWAQLLRLTPGPVERVTVSGHEGVVWRESGGRLWVGVTRGDDLDLVAVDPRTGATQVLWPAVHAGGRASVRVLP